MGAAAVSGAVWQRIRYTQRLAVGRTRSYASSMQTTAPSLERDLPLPVRVELRSLDDDGCASVRECPPSTGSDPLRHGSS